MENVQRLNVISGSNTRSVDNYKRAKKQSVRSDGAREIHHAKKRKKKVSLANRIKRDLAFTALGAGLTLTGIGISQIDNLKNYFEESAIVNDTLKKLNKERAFIVTIILVSQALGSTYLASSFGIPKSTNFP